LPAKSIPAAAPELAPTSVSPRVRYRVLPKGAGLVYTGAYDPVSGASLTFAKGETAETEAPVAAELEDRGLVEVLGDA
jgi:hypothetical protein